MSNAAIFLRRPIVWIVLLGFVLRLGSMAVNHPQMRWQNDARMSIPAVRILEGKGLTLRDESGPTAYRPPLYILWLSGAYAIFGKFSTLGPSFLQILVSTGSILLLFLLTKQIFKRDREALTAALLLAIHPYTVYHDAALYHTFLSTALLLGGLLGLLKGIETKKAKPLLISGMLFGLCVLITSTIVPFLLLAIVLGLFLWKIPLRNRFMLVGIFILGMSFTWGPWIIRNAIAFNKFIPLTTESGVTLWMGNSPNAKELLPKRLHEGAPVPQGTPFNIPENYDGCRPEGWCRGGVSEYEENTALTAMATDWIKSHPTEFLELTAWRIFSIWSPLLTPEKNFSNSHILNGLIKYGFAAWNIVLFTLIVLGVGLAWKTKRHESVILQTLLAITGTGAYALFLYYTKYRIPFEAILLPFAGAGLVMLLERFLPRAAAAVTRRQT